jgi:hypothetical protein
MHGALSLAATMEARTMIMKCGTLGKVQSGLRQGQAATERWLVRMLTTMAMVILASSTAFAEDAKQSKEKKPATAAATANSQKQFAVPRQALDTALAAFSAVTRMQVLTPGEVTQGLTTPGVSGVMMPEKALRRLLDGTGLTYRFLNADTVTLERVLLQPGRTAAA